MVRDTRIVYANRADRQEEQEDNPAIHDRLPIYRMIQPVIILQEKDLLYRKFEAVGPIDHFLRLAIHGIGKYLPIKKDEW